MAQVILILKGTAAEHKAQLEQLRRAQA